MNFSAAAGGTESKEEIDHGNHIWTILKLLIFGERPETGEEQSQPPLAALFLCAVLCSQPVGAGENDAMQLFFWANASHPSRLLCQFFFENSHFDDGAEKGMARAKVEGAKLLHALAAKWNCWVCSPEQVAPEDIAGRDVKPL